MSGGGMVDFFKLRGGHALLSDILILGNKLELTVNSYYLDKLDNSV